MFREPGPGGCAVGVIGGGGREDSDSDRDSDREWLRDRADGDGDEEQGHDSYDAGREKAE